MLSTIFPTLTCIARRQGRKLQLKRGERCPGAADGRNEISVGVRPVTALDAVLPRHVDRVFGEGVPSVVA